MRQAHGNAGYEVRSIDIGAIDFPLLRRKVQWDVGPLPSTLEPAQADIHWAEHLVFVFPLWLGGMPALLWVFWAKRANSRRS